MFKSFFPNPKLFFLSVLGWASITIFIWYVFKVDIGNFLGFEGMEDPAPIGIRHFYTPEFQLFYLYCLVCVGIFAATWFVISPHKWQYWSILGSAAILFSTYFSVQVSVALNNWRRPFFDLIQKAFEAAGDDTTSEEGGIAASQFYELMLQFAEIAFMFIFVFVLTRFFVSHYVFRWRTAMNDYYVESWSKVRTVEGASQRVQEDTMRFAGLVEGLGVSMIDSIMTLFAFLPILWDLSVHVERLPIVGAIPHPLFVAILFWSIFGTGLLALVGIKLPGLEFKNQRVEAAYRKELVYGEDNAERAQPPTLQELFRSVRKNYFRLYFHYMYFNIARSLYLQADGLFAYFILIPTIVTAGATAFTFGLLQQILTAFNQVGNSFQYLVNSWTTIIDLISVQKRLRAFEATIEGKPLPKLDQDYLRSM